MSSKTRASGTRASKRAPTILTEGSFRVCPAFACPPREPDLRLPFAHVHCTVHCSSHSDYKGLSSWWRGRYSPCVMQDKDLTHARYHLTRYQVTVSLSEGRAKVGSNAMVVRVPCVRLACTSRAARDRVMQSGGEPRLCILSVLCSLGRGEENA